MISTAFCWPFWLCCYLFWPELITGTPPQQFNTAIITRLGVPVTRGLRCPLHALSQSVKVFKRIVRDILTGVIPCVAMPRDILIRHREFGPASSDAGCVST